MRRQVDKENRTVLERIGGKHREDLAVCQRKTAEALAQRGAALENLAAVVDQHRQELQACQREAAADKQAVLDAAAVGHRQQLADCQMATLRDAEAVVRHEQAESDRKLAAAKLAMQARERRLMMQLVGAQAARAQAEAAAVEAQAVAVAERAARLAADERAQAAEGAAREKAAQLEAIEAAHKLQMAAVELELATRTAAGTEAALRGADVNNACVLRKRIRVLDPESDDGSSPKVAICCSADVPADLWCGPSCELLHAQLCEGQHQTPKCDS